MIYLYHNYLPISQRFTYTTMIHLYHNESLIHLYHNDLPILQWFTYTALANHTTMTHLYHIDLPKSIGITYTTMIHQYQSFQSTWQWSTREWLFCLASGLVTADTPYPTVAVNNGTRTQTFRSSLKCRTEIYLVITFGWKQVRS